MKIELYDTTLRDGAQQSGISLSLKDKINITLKLDELGIDTIEVVMLVQIPKMMNILN